MGLQSTAMIGQRHPPHKHTFFSPYGKKKPEEVSSDVIRQVGKEKLLETLTNMLLIRNFEIRAESAYQHGKIGGFFHSYQGEEAIATACVNIFGKNNWFIDFYRCHALPLLLEENPNILMAELYGKRTGNAMGRGGSMHLYSKRMLGGFAIVGGQLPVAAGAAFSLKYLGKNDQVAICFMGEGSVAQGMFHETMNLAALWDLPCIFIIENNQWGMGTHVTRAIAKEPIGESQALSYGIQGYTLDGMDYFALHSGFSHIFSEIQKERRPILVECICERFRGHSISDPALYRSKDELCVCMKKDPISYFAHRLEQANILDETTYKEMNQKEKNKVIQAMQFAEESPWPNVAVLEEGVYAP